MQYDLASGFILQRVLFRICAGALAPKYLKEHNELEKTSKNVQEN